MSSLYDQLATRIHITKFIPLFHNCFGLQYVHIYFENIKYQGKLKLQTIPTDLKYVHLLFKI